MVDELLKDKTKTAKKKSETISKWLFNGTLTTNELIVLARKVKDSEKSTCIEALEYVTKQHPELTDEGVYSLEAIRSLTVNAENDGTVVRWASAYALGEILKSKTWHNKDLLPAMEALCEKEEDKGIKRKYVDALKKLKK